MSPLPNPVLVTSAERSEIELLLRYNDIRLVNPANTDMSEIELTERDRPLRLIACSNPVKSLMLDPLALSWVNAAISDVVMTSSGIFPNSVAIAARRLESGRSIAAPTAISSKSTVTPLLWRTGMCVSMDTGLRGLTFTLTMSPFPNPVLVTSAEMSEIEFLSRFRRLRLVNPANDDMSEIELYPRYSDVRFVNLANDEMFEIKLLLRYSDVRFVNPSIVEMSEIELFPRDSDIRLIACSSPVKSLMLELLALSRVKAAISDVVMGSSDALSNSAAIAARRLASGRSATTPAIISSNSTVTPLLSRTGMCVSMDTELRGLPFTLTASPLPSSVLVTSADRSEIELFLRNSNSRLVSPTNTDMSEIELSPRCSHVRLVNPVNDEMSEIELPSRIRNPSLVNPDNDEMSEIELPSRISHVSLIACSSPVKSLMLDLLASSWVKVAISDVVMGSSDALPNAAAIAARRLTSGRSTTFATILSNSTVTPLL